MMTISVFCETVVSKDTFGTVTKQLPTLFAIHPAKNSTRSSSHHLAIFVTESRGTGTGSFAYATMVNELEEQKAGFVFDRSAEGVKYEVMAIEHYKNDPRNEGKVILPSFVSRIESHEPVLDPLSAAIEDESRLLLFEFIHHCALARVILARILSWSVKMRSTGMPSARRHDLVYDVQ